MTTKSQPTPGPWRTANGQGQYHTTVVCNGWRSAPGKKTICNVSPEPRTSAAWAEAEANARLLANAPDLLDSLKRALIQLEAYKAILSGHRATVKKARAVIARVEQRR